MAVIRVPLEWVSHGKFQNALSGHRVGVCILEWAHRVGVHLLKRVVS